MQKYRVKFHTYHESYNGYDHSDGWDEFIVEARHSKSAINKAKKLWRKKRNSAYWVNSTTCFEHL
jgi:hypothetical protein